jgi:CBS domain-containing protein
VTLSQERTLHDVLYLIQKNIIKRIVVIENDMAVGIVTERDIGIFLETDKTDRSLSEIPVQEIMTRNLVTVTLDQHDLLPQCAIRMDTFQISSVIIVNEKGSLVGILTKSDLVRDYASKYPRDYKVKDYMSKKIITCRKTDSLYFGLEMLNKNRIRRLVVTNNDGKALGVLTYDAFLRNSCYFKKPSRNYLLPENSGVGMTVGDIVGPELITVNSEDDLAKAANLMINYKVSGIPVVDIKDELKGVISSTNIVEAYAKVEHHRRLSKADPHFT